MVEIDWKNPNYAEIWHRRLANIRRLRENPGLVDGVKEYYKANPCAFINDFGITVDPRNAELGVEVTIPFILFPRQAEFVEWVVERWRGREDGLVEKSRDMGVSWLCVGVAVWMWLFHTGSVVGFGSRKEEYVDKIGDPKSLFWKIRQFIGYLPEELRPNGYDDRKHAPHMRIMNPENGAVITGEAGDNIGRGNRTGIYFKDESAHYEHAEAIDAALSQTSNCKIDISTPNGAGNAFYRKRHGGRIKVFVFDWRAQPLDAKILTPSGWKMMGDIGIGDFVVGSDGRKTRVESITPHGKKEVYCVAFDDGSSTECCEDHLWSVISYGNQRAERRHILKTMTLREIAENYVNVDSRGFKNHLYQIPMVSPIECFEKQSLPIDPYVLGCILGDGSISSKSTGPHLLTVGDAEIIDHCILRLPSGVTLKHDRGIHYRFSVDDSYRGGNKGRGKHSPICSAIRDLGLLGTVSHTKFIPDIYKIADIESRIDLLRGLFDTDGSAPKNHAGAVKFSTTSKRLADDVVFVVQSLGGTAKQSALKPQKTAVFPGGRVCNRRSEAYLLSVKLPDWIIPFKLQRKVDAFKPAVERPPRRSIVDISFVGTKEVQCITVANDNGLYVTDNFIVTHNCDPRKDDAWYQKQCDTLDPVIVAQEIDRNYEASISDAFIPSSLVDAAMRNGPADVEAVGFVQYSLDVARFGNDKTVLTCRQGRVVFWQKAWGKVDTEDTVGRVVSEIRLFKKPDQIAVDVIGVGAGVVDKLKRIYPDIVAEVNSANRVDDGMNFNLRAQMWDNMREWLANGPVSLPNSQELRSDLTALKYYFRGGVRLMESKDDARKRGIKSPDFSDSLALSFAEPVKVKRRPVSVTTPWTQSVPGMGY